MNEADREADDALNPALWPGLRPMWRRRLLWNGYFLPVALLCVLCTLSAVGYGGTAYINAARGFVAWDPHTVVDDALPALPWTLVLYLSFDLLFVAAAFSAPRDDRGRTELVLFVQALVVVGALSFAVFLLLPCDVPIRSDPALHTGAFAAAFSWLHKSDPPWNAWPSLHVSQTLMCTAAIARWRTADRPWLRFALGLVGLAIALSTLTTKQHFLFDVLTGAVLGWAAWSLFLRPAFDRLD